MHDGEGGDSERNPQPVVRQVSTEQTRQVSQHEEAVSRADKRIGPHFLHVSSVPEDRESHTKGKR